MSRKLGYSYYSFYAANIVKHNQISISPRSIVIDFLNGLNNISSMLGSASEIYEIFDQTDIGPYQCDEVIQSLRDIDKATKQLCQSITNENFIPHQSLLALLYNISEHISCLLRNVSQFRLVCLEQVEEKSQLKEKIRESLNDLVDISKLLKEEILSSYYKGLAHMVVPHTYKSI